MTPEPPDPPPVSPDPWTELKHANQCDSLFATIDGSSERCNCYMRLVDVARAADALRHQQEIADLQRWKDALTDALVVDWCLNDATANDPRAAIAMLIEWNVKIHDDPAVSKLAADRAAALSTAEATIQQLQNRPTVSEHARACNRMAEAEATIASMGANQLVLQEAVATQSDLIASLTAERDRLHAQVMLTTAKAGVD